MCRLNLEKNPPNIEESEQCLNNVLTNFTEIVPRIKNRRDRFTVQDY